MRTCTRMCMCVRAKYHQNIINIEPIDFILVDFEKKSPRGKCVGVCEWSEFWPQQLNGERHVVTVGH